MAEVGGGERGDAHGEGPTLPFATGGWTGAQLLPSEEGPAWLPGCIRASAAANCSFRSTASLIVMLIRKEFSLLRRYELSFGTTSRLAMCGQRRYAESGGDDVGPASRAYVLRIVHRTDNTVAERRQLRSDLIPTRCSDSPHRSAFQSTWPRSRRTGGAVCRAISTVIPPIAVHKKSDACQCGCRQHLT